MYPRSVTEACRLGATDVNIITRISNEKLTPALIVIPSKPPDVTQKAVGNKHNMACQLPMNQTQCAAEMFRCAVWEAAWGRMRSGELRNMLSGDIHTLVAYRSKEPLWHEECMFVTRDVMHSGVFDVSL